jgi:hypothetical protein
MRHKCTVIVSDVAKHEIFDNESRKIMLRANARVPVHAVGVVFGPSRRDDQHSLSNIEKATRACAALS